MDQIRLILPHGKEVLENQGTILYQVIQKYKLEQDIPVVLAKVGEEYVELTNKLNKGGVIKPITIESTIGIKTYARTLQFVFIKAVNDIFPESKITIEHSLSKGIFGEIHKEESLDAEDIIKIKNRMKEIIDEDIEIKKVSVKKQEAIDIFSSYGMEDKTRLLSQMDNDFVKLYELQGRYDYFYGPMAYSTGVLKVFDLIYYDPGFILRFPEEKAPNTIAPFIEHKKLAKIFYETEQWLNILEVGDVGALNEKVSQGNIFELIRVAEALHEKKIAYIADTIQERKEVKIVLIAGPSSSGKTTFARRLGIQLRVNGLIPIPISLDDYFVNREDTPKDEYGEYDFEAIEALDLQLFNKHLGQLLSNEEVEIPSFNFRTGKREWLGHKMKIPQNGVLIIEGIHGLNNRLTETIPCQNKFKIYISALTQLNLDNHNRIATTDVRIIRRIVRDYLSRGYGGETTLTMWPSIRRGEEKNIFVFQEEADVMFNSTLVYELCVLKPYALEELAKIKPESPVYYEAWRLRSFLNFFKEIHKDMIPDNSILREFVGGSCFYKY